MVIEKSANPAQKALLARLAHAFAGGDETLQAVLGELGVEQTERTCFLNEARALRQRARAQTPQASSTELELALGVLWVLRAPQTARTRRSTP